jgi:hypothetical protein
MGKKIDHTSIEDSRQRQVAANIIDIVEAAIREANPQVEELALAAEEDGEKTNTLLHGTPYFDLEDELTTLLVENFNKKPKKEVITDVNTTTHT